MCNRLKNMTVFRLAMLLLLSAASASAIPLVNVRTGQDNIQTSGGNGTDAESKTFL